MPGIWNANAATYITYIDLKKFVALIYKHFFMLSFMYFFFFFHFQIFFLDYFVEVRFVFIYIFIILFFIYIRKHEKRMKHEIPTTFPIATLCAPNCAADSF